jgi:hypothetical protein
VQALLGTIGRTPRQLFTMYSWRSSSQLRIVERTVHAPPASKASCPRSYGHFSEGVARVARQWARLAVEQPRRPF